jgi:hypothetical protein
MIATGPATGLRRDRTGVTVEHGEGWSLEIWPARVRSGEAGESAPDDPAGQEPEIADDTDPGDTA